MSSESAKPRILVVDDEMATRMVLEDVLTPIGSVDLLNSSGMDVARAVEAIRAKLENLDVLILDGQYGDKSDEQTAKQVIEALETDLIAKGITVIVYSGDPKTLEEVKAHYPSVAAIAKGNGNGDYDLIKDRIEKRVPFQVEEQA